MIVRISTIFCLVLALVAASDVSNETDDDDDGIATAAIDIDQDDIAEDDIAEDDIAEDDSKFEISFKVNRLMHDDSDEADDDNEDDDDGEDDDDNVDGDGEDEDADPDWDELWNYDKKKDIPPVYVIILGGFRWDLLEDHIDDMSAFAYLKKHGVSIPSVTPVFPPEDYPVWTSLATGRHPEDHGIVGDFMYDLKNEQIFNASDLQSTRMAGWWKDASPFWSTAATHGKKIAFYNWHDCQLPGAALENPKDCRPYEALPNNAHPSKSKIAREFDEAFTKLWKHKYDMAVVYTDLLRRTAETHGPNSQAMVRALSDIDDVLEAKLTDIRSKATTKNIHTNVLILSDYGITDTDETTDVNIDDFVDMDDVQYLIYSSGYASIVPYALRHEKLLHSMRDMPGVDVYLAKRVQEPTIDGSEIIPEKLQYGRGDNAQDILVVAKPSFQIISPEAEENDRIIRVHNLKDANLKAGTGYNPLPEEIIYPFIDKRTIITKQINDTIIDYGRYHKFKWDMETQAFALGPDFKSNYVHGKRINSVDLYQLLCFLMQIEPEANNDGDWENIEDIMIISSATPLISFMTIWITIPLFLLHHLV